jgi:hypothetical protein
VGNHFSAQEVCGQNDLLIIGATGMIARLVRIHSSCPIIIVMPIRDTGIALFVAREIVRSLQFNDLVGIRLMNASRVFALGCVGDLAGCGKTRFIYKPPLGSSTWPRCQNRFRMLKKARFFARPTLVRRDAPCPKQGRRE